MEPGQQQRLGPDVHQDALSAPASAAGAYEEVAYPGYVYPHTHPARLEALGRLFGLSPAPAAGCRVLELGCGDGANSLAIAQTLPEATVVGVDASGSAIARGRALAAAAELGNVELRTGDFGAVESLARLGPVDYVIAHGVYSWIPPAARAALLELTRRALAPQGIAFVSYNAYPGSYLRDMTRDILAYHLQGVRAPAERLVRAQHLMRTIVSVDSPTPYARVLREQLQRMLDGSDALLYHDDLAAISTPFYFHEFMEHAAARGLQFLSEADLADSQLRDVPEGVGGLVAALPPDVVVREQYLDFFSNRAFRQTLLVHAELPLERVLDDAALEALVLSSSARPTDDGFLGPDGAVMRTADALVAAAMDELCERWPEPVALPELVTAAARRAGTAPVSGEARRGLRRVLLDAHLAHLVLLSAGASALTAHPGPRPRASALARAQSAAGTRVLSTLIPGNVPLDDEADRRLLALLDGTRDRPALADQLAITPETLEQALQRLAGHGLISR
ncbi:MAG TPA: methyltransferase regulatory domain-containing protein [Solirubrobacteraceae bacterium]|nr:methyltransferase regulatory domain-containing protein [Solirubrobacteraceae bacterium]